ncbi:unnamed protein product, partial [Hapterophycus canaliculatus]
MTRSLLRMTRLDSPASCVDYSPDGELLVVGFGARERSTTDSQSGGSAKTGGFVILNEADFVMVFEARDAKK